jgi:hypothetical protein
MTIEPGGQDLISAGIKEFIQGGNLIHNLT